SNAARLLEEVAVRYKAYGIDEVKPFVMVKADAGTYGMGVMRVHEAEEIFQINRKQRNKMASAKEGLEVTRVIIQEGVPTALRWGPAGAAAEPVIYMIDEDVVGSFYRIHEGRGSDENLNAPGMTFEPIACQTQSEADERRRHAYEVVARLALLAAAREVAAAGAEPGA
ncbi:MAG TPA: glutamate--cysteine ligase, partial [Gammaproteobacteria bacterium]|nr:glutamate--cysteine ligase [Gammaproteobacteria bacterium]